MVICELPSLLFSSSSFSEPAGKKGCFLLSPHSSLVSGDPWMNLAGGGVLGGPPGWTGARLAAQCRGYPSQTLVPQSPVFPPRFAFFPSAGIPALVEYTPNKQMGPARFRRQAEDLGILPCSYVWLTLTLFLNSCSVFQDMLYQGSANFQGSDSNYFTLSEPYGLCPSCMVQHIDSMQTGCMAVFQ